MKQWLLITGTLRSIPADAFADETLKWRHVQHAASVQSLQVGDDNRHTVSLYRLTGMALFFRWKHRQKLGSWHRRYR